MIAAVVVLAIAVAAIIAFFVARSSRRRPASSTYAQVDGDVFGSKSSIPNSNASIPMPGTEYSLAPKPNDDYALAPTPGKIQGSNAPMQHYKNIESYGVAPGPAPGHE